MNNVAGVIMINIGSLSSFLLDQKNLNTNIFITFFRIIHLVERMLTYLTNLFFDHAISASNPGL